MYNVDAGYLTFKMSFGNFDMWQAKYGKQVSIFATDNKPERREIYKAYKEYRNVGKEERVSFVKELRDHVMKEAQLPICSIQGLEADDIVACWNIFNPQDKIIGVDKDFFQLPNVEYVYYHDLKPYSVISCLGNLPQYLQKLASRNFALYQILLGDVADNIPRLLAKGKEGKEQIEDLLNTRDLESYLMKTFKPDEVLTNAKLVLFPYYTYFEPTDFSIDWFDYWCNGEYYNPKYWQGLYARIQACKLPNKVNTDTEELFSLI